MARGARSSAASFNSTMEASWQLVGRIVTYVCTITEGGLSITKGSLSPGSLAQSMFPDSRALSFHMQTHIREVLYEDTA